jgi:hypothetical protein
MNIYINVHIFPYIQYTLGLGMDMNMKIIALLLHILDFDYL